MGDPVIVSASQFHNYNIPLANIHLAGALNQEEALVRAGIACDGDGENIADGLFAALVKVLGRHRGPRAVRVRAAGHQLHPRLDQDSGLDTLLLLE